MYWHNKRYYPLNEALQSHFGHKVQKLSLDGNFTCPNRDGKIGVQGCLFCSEKGSGEFAGDAMLSLHAQIAQQKQLLAKKWPAGKYIAYFQNFTNTYASCDVLYQKYSEVLEDRDIVGLAIATRPDCLENDVLEVLDYFNQKTYLWVELGLQTIHANTAKLIRRGYPLATYEKAVQNLRKRNINVITHLIVGLPRETQAQMLDSVRYIAHTDTQGIKLHLLHILKNTDLYRFYTEHPFALLTQDQYIAYIVDAITLLPPDMVIHRLTGDGARDLLVAPRWSLNKRAVLNGIDKELQKRDVFQGNKYP